MKSFVEGGAVTCSAGSSRYEVQVSRAVQQQQAEPPVTGLNEEKVDPPETKLPAPTI